MTSNRYTYPKSRRLLKGSEFHEVKRSCAEQTGLYMRVRVLSSRHSKLGLIVPKRFGDAVHRNLFKRRIRECYRLLAHQWPSAHIVVIPQPAALQALFDDLSQELSQLVFNSSASLTANVLQ